VLVEEVSVLAKHGQVLLSILSVDHLRRKILKLIALIEDTLMMMVKSSLHQ
jgi:hypothetical protein